MNSEDYVHPEFGWLAPAPRLRRELRIALLSMIVGFSIGAITVIGMMAATHDANTGTPIAAHEAAAPSVLAAAVPNRTARVPVSPSDATFGQAGFASAADQRTADRPHAANNGSTSASIPLDSANQSRGAPESTIDVPAAAAPGSAVVEALDPSQIVPTKPQKSKAMRRTRLNATNSPRVTPGGTGDVSENQTWRVGGAYARARSSTGRGFWDWSP
jgi:hypothetical protein